MTKDEIMNLVNRSLFATIGYTDERGRQNVRRVFCVWHKGLDRQASDLNEHKFGARAEPAEGRERLPVLSVKPTEITIVVYSTR